MPERLTDPGALLWTTHVLSDGSSVRMRLTRPSDAARVRAFLAELSEETRRRRFGGEVADSDVTQLTFYDPRERLAVAATRSSNGGEQIVGIADVTLLATGLAEVGVVVDDDSQGRGVGKLLSEAIASLALGRGATHLKAVRADENTPMGALLERLGPTVRTEEDGTGVLYTRLTAQQHRAA